MGKSSHVLQEPIREQHFVVQVFPTNGTKSTSLWEAKDKTVLQEWLDEFLDAECNSEVFEVLTASQAHTIYRS